MGFQYNELDIANKTQQELAEHLNDVDVVYVAGGYTYYLLEQMRMTGFDLVLTDFIDRGGMYIGASAGALIAGPDIEPCARLDDPEYGPSLTSTKGLGLVDIVPMPHYDMSERNSVIDEIIEQYNGEYTIIPITDDEAIVSSGVKWHKVALSSYRHIQGLSGLLLISFNDLAPIHSSSELLMRSAHRLEYSPSYSNRTQSSSASAWSDRSLCDEIISQSCS